MPEAPVYPITTSLGNITFSKDEVLKELRSINVNKSCGPDEMHPRVMRELADVLALPLSMIFNSALESGVVPLDWRLANVTPIFKKGNRHQAENYRPVSLTSVVCKIMEKLIRGRIIQHLDANNVINPGQHGFTVGRSCTTNLLEFLDICTSWLDEGEGVDVLYTDFMKAFDSVPHARLLSKCQSVGIEGSLLNWISSFLGDRYQRVVINGVFSEWTPVVSGVPQGSVLGPLLFVIFINDLPSAIRNISKLFADDAKVFSQYKNYQTLQTDIDNIMGWCSDWQLKLNIGKCSIMSLGKNENRHEYKFNTNNSTVLLKRTEVEKDLGIIIDDKLKFDKHINEMTNKANRMVGLIRRSFEFLDNKLFKLLFKAVVRPILEYGHTIWSPHLRYLNHQIERVQKRATKMLPGMSNLRYIDRLKKLDLPSLEYRRLRGDLIETFKIIRGYYNIENTFFELSKHTSTRGHQYKIQHQYSRLDTRKYFFTNRVALDWNDLPKNVVEADSINCFKNRVDKHFKTINRYFAYTKE